MSLPKSPLMYTPFSNLGKKITPGVDRRPCKIARIEREEPEDADAVFLAAMADVEPLSAVTKITKRNPASPPKIMPDDSDSEQVRKLIDLVLKGEGYSVADTPEYMEGTGYNVHPEMTRRLHQGDFSIQANLDLHGLNSAEAKKEFEAFLKRTIYTGKRAVLVIHGRGLSSPGEPVLKAKVHEWLTRSHWRKWVIAFTSAASHDGGAGATYILLRDRPVSKRLRKRKPA